MLRDIVRESDEALPSPARGRGWPDEVGSDEGGRGSWQRSPYRRTPSSDPASRGHLLPRAGEGRAATIAAHASAALLAELETYPKPGLVSLVDSGSHDDMDAGTFRRSIAALEPFFARLAEAGARGADLPDLRAIGLEAEAAMLAATGGVNTHRGAIFALGLLCAAAGAGARHPAEHVRERWGEALASERPRGSHGAGAMRRFGVGGARGEAAGGFSTAVRVGLPALRDGRRLAGAGDPSPARGGRWPDEVGSDEGAAREAAVPPNTLNPATPSSDPASRGHLLPQAGEGREAAARVHAFFALLECIDDTNLLHRGAAEGLAFAQTSAAAFLDAGGVGAPDWHARAVAIHRACVARRLSPGGSADLLAVTLFLDAIENRR